MWRLWVTAFLLGAVLADQGGEWQRVVSKYKPQRNSKARPIVTTRLFVPEYVLVVPNITDRELQYASTVLFQSDVNNMAENVDIIFEDNSNVINRFEVKNGVKLEQKPTFKALNDLFRLYDGKITPSSRVDRVLKEKLENNFLEAILKTSVIKNLFGFLANTNKPLTTLANQRELLKKIWFTTFNRAASTSSAFEHIFRGEKEAGVFSGLHNWYFIYEYLKKKQVKVAEKHSFEYVDPSSNKVMVDLKSWTLTHSGLTKTSSVLFGISPELEIALATLCFVYRTKKPCVLALGDHQMDVQVYPWDIRHQNVLVISTYYPTLNDRYNPKFQDMAPFQGRYQRQRYNGIQRSSKIPVRARG